MPIWRIESPAPRAREDFSPAERSGSRDRPIRIALLVVFAFLSGCAGSGLDQTGAHESRTGKASNLSDRTWTEERRALYEQAREGLRRSRERYVETTRPLLQQKFRDEHPNLGEAELEILVNDALENGFRPDTARQPERPIRLPPMHCLPSAWGAPPQTNCY